MTKKIYEIFFANASFEQKYLEYKIVGPYCYSYCV